MEGDGGSGDDSDRFIQVTNWDEYQHYKDRDPPWIKLYNSLLDDIEFMRLSSESRWLLVGLFLLASRHGNAIPYDLDAIQWRLRLPEPPDLQPLRKSGFINVVQDDSTALARRKQNGVPEKSRVEERREDARGSHTREDGNPNLSDCPECGLPTINEVCDKCRGAEVE